MTDARPSPAGRVILEAEGLTVRYPGSSEPALADATLHLAAGELLAVVGPNGGGKSTLLRALLGLVDAERGEARVDGRAVASWDREALARRVAVVPQSETPAFALRVEESVQLGRYPYLGAFAAAGARDHHAVREALERCDVWPLRHRRTDTLSGGEWQRVRLARALAQEPAALLLDEPTASLDVRHAMALLELVASLVPEGVAALVVTHDLNLAARYAHRVALLDHGRIVREGTPSHVFDEATLGRVFQWPVAVTTWCDGAPQVTPLRPHDLPHRPEGH